MKVKIEGKKVVYLARIVSSLTQFNGTVNVKMDHEQLTLTASNSVNGRSVQHMLNSHFFSVLDNSGIANNLSVKIIDLVDSFENFANMDDESVSNYSNCVLEIVDEKLIINFFCLGDFVRITLYESVVDPVFRRKLESNPTGDVKSLEPKQLVSDDERDTPDIEDLIADAEANNMPEYILKTMKAFKKKNDEVIVIE